MKITPALEYERLRQDADSQNKIILHKDGKFYHVYEWSAWLLKTIACTEEFQAQRGDAKILQCNRYNSKHGEYVMLGFPLESVSKYIPQYDTYEEMEDGDLKIAIAIPDPTKTTEDMTAAFEEWKQTQPYKDKSQRSNRQIMSGDQKPAVLARSGLFQIVSELLSYPIEQKTPAENVEFLCNMKQKIVALL